MRFPHRSILVACWVRSCPRMPLDVTVASRVHVAGRRGHSQWFMLSMIKAWTCRRIDYYYVGGPVRTCSRARPYINRILLLIIRAIAQPRAVLVPTSVSTS